MKDTDMILSILRSDLKVGAYITKEAPPDVQTKENGLAVLTTELRYIVPRSKSTSKATEQQFSDLTTHYKGVKAESEELKAQVLKHTADYAALVTRQQTLEQALDQVKKEMDAPILQGGSALVECDSSAAIECSAGPSCSRAAMPTSSSRTWTTWSTLPTTARR